MVPNPWARRAGTIHVSYRRRSAESVGSDPARRAAPVTGRAGPGGRPTGRCGVLRPVRAGLRPAERPAVDGEGDLAAVDVSQVPLPSRVRVVVPGGVGLDHLAPVLPDRD